MNSSFIKNLSEKINKTIVYSPTGKYGKNELDKSETAKRKMEIFLLAMPSKTEEIKDYVLFAKMVGAFSNGKVRKKVKILLNSNDPLNEDIKMAKEVFSAEVKKTFVKFFTFCILPILVVIYLLCAWYTSNIQWWDTIWQVLCYVFVFPYIVMAGLFPLVIWLNKPHAFAD